MQKKRTDRTKFSEDFVANWLSHSDSCEMSPEEGLNRFSSIPTVFYNQQHCTKTRKINVFERQFNCSIMPMFGIDDLNTSNDLCNGTITQQLTDTTESIEVDECLPACIDETVELTNSFTLFSEDLFKQAVATWHLPDGLLKEDVVWLEIFYGSRFTRVRGQKSEVISECRSYQVNVLEPQTLSDLLSNIGGSLGLYLGGSIFSILEFLFILSMCLVSLTSYFIK